MNATSQVQFAGYPLILPVTYCSPSKYHIDLYSVPLKFRLVPNVITLRDAVFSLRLGHNKDGRIAIAGVTGQWAIGNIVVNILARYDTNTRMVLLDGCRKLYLSPYKVWRVKKYSYSLVSVVAV